MKLTSKRKDVTVLNVNSSFWNSRTSSWCIRTGRWKVRWSACDRWLPKWTPRAGNWKVKETNFRAVLKIWPEKWTTSESWRPKPRSTVRMPRTTWTRGLVWCLRDLSVSRITSRALTCRRRVHNSWSPKRFRLVTRRTSMRTIMSSLSEILSSWNHNKKR